MIHSEGNHDKGSQVRETGGPSLARRHWDQCRVIGYEELGIGNGGGGPSHHGVKYMDEVLGLFAFGGRGLDQDEGLNAGGQIVGICHPKFQRQDFLGKGRRHNVRAKATRRQMAMASSTARWRTLRCCALVSGAISHQTGPRSAILSTWERRS
jgi:hypothetical protein